MFNSGYALVDCNGLNLLAQSEVTVDGLYVKCKAAYDSGKPIIACNCQYGSGVAASPIAVMCIIEAGVYVFTSSILQIRVAADDGVTITSLIGG